ncbi:MAG: hypothetical protein ACOC8A_02115 [bacterium]
MVPGVFKGRGWLSADLHSDGFKTNRREVVSACIDAGINYMDACTWQEVMAYSEALRGRREKMHLGFSWYQEEMRDPRHRTCKSLLQPLDKGMKRAKLDYVDLWRITMHEKSSRHSKGEVEEMMKALEKARLTGSSSHDRPHIKWMIETYPDIVQVIVTPYTAKSKLAKHPKEHKPILPEPKTAKMVCTGCHGEHRLESRVVRWNKKTGELLPEEDQPQ